MGSNPAQGIKSFSPDENVFQGLSVLGHFKLHYLIIFRRGLDCESICDPPGGQRCAVGSRDLLNLYIYIYIYIILNNV